MKRKMVIIITLILLIASLGFWWYLHSDSSFKSEIYAPEGIAIEGYDVVAIFKSSGLIKGKDEFTYKWKDAHWKFSEKENLEIFMASPEMYLPQYGGYCAYGASRGYKAPVEIETWTVVNGKLYFNYNLKVREKWMEDQAEFIKKADQVWLDIRSK